MNPEYCDPLSQLLEAALASKHALEPIASLVCFCARLFTAKHMAVLLI